MLHVRTSSITRYSLLVLSPTNGIGFSTRIGARRQQRPVRLAHDGADRAGGPGAVGPGLDAVAAVGEGGQRAAAEAGLGADEAGVRLVREEAVGLAVGGDA